MIKDGNTITTNLLKECPTTEKNGVEVTIKSITNIDKYLTALKSIKFFPNIYIDSTYKVATEINNIKLKYFTNFAISSDINYTINLLLGNVLYPINFDFLTNEARTFLNEIYYSGINIKFDIGELNITPNRESIIYNSNTIKLLNDRIIATKKELYNIVNTALNKDYTDLYDYYQCISKSGYYNLFKDEIVFCNGLSWGTFPYKVKECNLTNVTYKGKGLKKYINILDYAFSARLLNFKGLVYDNKILDKNANSYLYRSTTYAHNKILILNEKARLSQVVRSYLFKNYNQYSVSTEIDRPTFKSEILKEIPSRYLLELQDKSELDYVIDEFYNRWASSEYLDLTTDTKFLKYKADISSGVVDKPKGKDILLYVYDNYSRKIVFNSITEAIKFLKDQNQGILLNTMNNNDDAYQKIADIKGFIYVKARKDIVSELRKRNLSFIVDTDKLCKKDKLLKSIVTILRYLNNTTYKYSVLPYVPSPLFSIFSNYCNIYNKYAGLYSIKKVLEEFNIQEDPYVKYICELYNNYCIKYAEIYNITNSEEAVSQLLNAALILKTKAFRLNFDLYNKVKHSKLINLLCKK